MPHGDAQVHAEREQSEHDQPEANVGRTPLAVAALSGLALGAVASILLADRARVVNGYVRRQLPCGLRHLQKFSGLTGGVTGQTTRTSRSHVAILPYGAR